MYVPEATVKTYKFKSVKYDFLKRFNYINI